MKIIISTLSVLSVFAILLGSNTFARTCTKGKACGNACIAQDAVCSAK